MVALADKYPQNKSKNVSFYHTRMTKVIKKSLTIVLFSIFKPVNNNHMFNKLIASILPFFPKKFIWIFSRSYISGENINDAMHVSKNLNSKGIKVTLDILGEFIKSLEEAEENKQEYLNLIDITFKNNIDGNYSLKPTSFGLLIDKEVCYRHIREIVEKAASYNSFIIPLLYSFPFRFT